MNLTLTERDKKLLGLTACLAILAVFGVHLIRPALAEHEALGSEYEAALQKQQEYQAQIDARAALDDSIAQNEAALKTAGEPYYPDGLETSQMDDIITGIALKNGLFPQSLTLTEAVPGAVRAYLTVQEQADGSAAPAEGADQTGEAADAPQTGGGVYIGTATLSAQGDVSQWLHFLDEVERSCKGLRVTNFSISDYDYVENNTQALAYQKEHREKRVGQILIELGFITETQVLEALAARLGLEIVSIGQMQVDLAAVRLIPRELAEKQNLLAVRASEGSLEIVTNDPLNYFAFEEVRQLTGCHVVIRLSELGPLQSAIRYYYAEVGAQQAAQTANEGFSGSDAELVHIEESESGDPEAPIVKLLSSLLDRAVSTGASDIHIEPFEGKTRVRMRIDGTIVDYVTLERSVHQPLIARIKIMANLDIAERRLPQDGHFRIRAGQEGHVNIRVSLLPTVFGEKAVLRILAAAGHVDHAEHFGMDDDSYARFLPMLNSPNGIIYLTGHLVLSTLHTNDAVSSVVRLADMGVDRYLIANSLVGLVAQRLMRKVCPHCAREAAVTPQEQALLGRDIRTVRRGAGCMHCNGTGYRGRVAVHEIVAVDRSIRRMISRGAEAEEIEAYAREHQGMKSLREKGLELVREGVTTPEELLRIAYYA